MKIMMTMMTMTLRMQGNTIGCGRCESDICDEDEDDNGNNNANDNHNDNHNDKTMTQKMNKQRGAFKEDTDKVGCGDNGYGDSDAF